MQRSGTDTCPVCGIHEARETGTDYASFYYVICPLCGEYFIPWYDDYRKSDLIFAEKLKSYLFYHKSKNRPFICSKKDYACVDQNRYRSVYNLTPEMVTNWYPVKFSDKVDLVLLKLDELSEYDGAHVLLGKNAERLLFCADIHSAGSPEGKDISLQLNYMTRFLTDNGYVNSQRNEEGLVFQLTPKALERIYELQKTLSNNKNVFVSMSFNEGTTETREAIRQAIIDSGYSPEFLDEIIHNKQIVPEMFRLIRESKFLILDISDPNYGAYYEAGYALGLGKEVIACCNRQIFDTDFGAETKYRKPHFDIAQKQLLLWHDYDDLTHQLTEWIRAIVK